MVENTELKISVVIPMYNASQSIVKALDSVKYQTYKCTYQILVVNDGSEDCSKETVEKYILENPQMNITLINQPNGGVSKARNEGLTRATGDYIAFLDSDDEWLPEKIEKQISVFQHNISVDLLGTNRNGGHFKNFLGYKFRHLTRISAKLLLLKNFFPTPTVIFKGEKKKAIFFEEDQRFMEDANCWISFCKSNDCYLLNESLVITGAGKPSFGSSGLSSKMWDMQKGELKNIQNAYKSNIINLFEYCFFYIYSLLKYFRRLILKSIRKRNL